MLKKVILALCLLVYNLSFSAKGRGDITVADLEEKEYKLEPNAEAAIIEQNKKITYRYTKQDGFMVFTEVYQRIKIYKKEALNWGIHYVYLERSSSSSDEELMNVKGKTFELVDGKIVEHKLKKEGIFKENYSDYWDRVKFSLPNVVEGSVIEFSYIIKSPYTTYIRPINLQERIPIKKLLVNLEIPEFYRFNTDLRQGDLKVNLQRSSSADKITFNSTQRGSGWNSSQVSYNSHDVDYRLNTYLVNQINIPSYKDEPYVSNVRNFTPTLEFFLQSIQYPNSVPKNYAYSWKDVLSKNKDNSAFKGEASKSNYYKDDLKELLEKGGIEEEKMIRIFDFVKNKMRWNEVCTSKAYDGVVDAYKKNVGSSGQINVILYSMLQKAGITVNPIFVASVQKTISIFPNNNAFDYLMVEVTLKNGEQFYLDATNKNTIPNVYSDRVLKGFSKKISNGNVVRDLDLRPKKPSLNTKMLVYKIDDEGLVTGSLQTSMNKYAAFAHRNQAKSDNEKRIEDIKEHTSVDELTDYKRTGFNKPYSKLKESFKFEAENFITDTGDEIYFHPLLFLKTKDNPLKQEERTFPVDWGANMAKKYIVNVTIPEGYEVVSLPGNIAIGLPNKNGVFSFSSKQVDNRIMFTVKEELNTGFFMAGEYPALKQFYKQLVEKQNEQIVLKKI